MTDLSPGDRYVALGSSFAAGPGLRPRSPGSPRHAMRSSINYAHLLADRLGLQLTDVSWSGATAAQIAERLPGRPAQLEAVTADTALVTLTCGGNDVGYIPRLTLASLPRSMQHLMGLRRCIAEIGDVPDEGFEALAGTFDGLLEAVHRRAPQATVVLVDYLTLLPPEDTAADPLPAGVASRGRQTAERLATETTKAAARAGCHYLAASSASRDHHAWSVQPWTTGFRLLPRGGAAYHPNAAGMRAVADLLVDALGRSPSTSPRSVAGSISSSTAVS
jgi:lysophospholipase L1-like esterase